MKFHAPIFRILVHRTFGAYLFGCRFCYLSRGDHLEPETLGHLGAVGGTDHLVDVPILRRNGAYVDRRAVEYALNVHYCINESTNCTMELCGIYRELTCR